MVRATSYEIQATGYKLGATSRELRPTRYKLQVMSHEPQTKSHEATSYERPLEPARLWKTTLPLCGRGRSSPAKKKKKLKKIWRDPGVAVATDGTPQRKTPDSPDDEWLLELPHVHMCRCLAWKLV